MKATQTVALIAILTLIAGCGSSNSTSDSDDTSFRTGTQGLELSLPATTPTTFIEGSGPEEMILEIHNRGAFPQSNEIGALEASVWAGGYDQNLLTIEHEGTEISIDKLAIDGATDLVLEGRSVYNSEGGYKPFILEIDPINVPKGVSRYSPTIKFATGFTYTTTASVPICYDPNPQSTRQLEKPCKFTESVSLSSQGAPVAVSSIEQDVVGGDDGKVLYRIFLENKGSGKIVNPSVALETNPFKDGYRLSELNNVFLAKFRVGAAEAKVCRPLVIKMIDGKGVSFCEFLKTEINPNHQAIETPVTIVLGYGYTNIIEKKINIEEGVSIAAGAGAGAPTEIFV